MIFWICILLLIAGLFLEGRMVRNQGKLWMAEHKRHEEILHGVELQLETLRQDLNLVIRKLYPPDVPVKHCYLISYALTLKNGCFIFDQVHLENDGKIDNSNYADLLNSLFGRALQKDPHVKSMAIVSLLYLGEKVVEEKELKPAENSSGENP